MNTFVIICQLVLFAALVLDEIERRKCRAEMRRLDEGAFEIMKKQHDLIDHLRNRIAELQALDKSEEWKKP